MYSLKKSSTKKFTFLQGSYFGQHGVHLVSLNVSGSIPRGSRCWVQLCSTIWCSTYLIPRVRTSVLSHPIPIPLILIAPQCNIHILDGFFLNPHWGPQGQFYGCFGPLMSQMTCTPSHFYLKQYEENLMFWRKIPLNVSVGWVTSWRKRNNSFLSLFDHSHHSHQPILFTKLTFTSRDFHLGKCR